MDRLIKIFDNERDADLRICRARGVAYQRDMKLDPVAYDAEYLARYQAYEGTATTAALNAGRCDMLARHAPKGASVLDFGAGAGTFVRAAQEYGYRAKGFDVIPQAVEHLTATSSFSDAPGDFDVITFWDSLEHIENPERVLRKVNRGAVVLVAIPIFDDLTRIRESKHYRPGEHLYYFTAQGFIDWMAEYGFELVDQSVHEMAAGRESIGAFAFRRSLPGYGDYIGAYQEMHAARFYGSSATELHLKTVAKVVDELQPHSILDFGCGRSDLVAHFWLDGARRIERYDPAIPALKRMPLGRVDLVLCCDVMEHIPLASVADVLEQVKAKGDRALFTISLKLARARLPDGRNAHCTLLTRDEWLRVISGVFGSAKTLQSSHDHEIVVMAEPKVSA